MPDPISAVLTQTATKFLIGMVSSYAAKQFRAITLPEQKIHEALKKYIDSTYVRCTRIKTILSEDPVNLLSCHVDQTFEISSAIIDHYALIDIIKDGSCVAITGTGGSGKSIFTKYLWTSLFVESRDRIPIFFEMRQLNEDKNSSIIESVHKSVLYGSNSIAIEEFSSAIFSGEIILILDGFDEVIAERRHEAEREIIRLVDNNPSAQIIISSRPDERFAGWPQFRSSKIQPLSREAVTDLIERAEFNSEVKSLMLFRLNNGLFESHNTFLTNPLLCYLMLVTIASEGTIETSRTLFYEQAYEALFFRHDLRKGGYVRKMNSGLDKNQFRTAFAFFSLKSYIASRIDMSEPDLLENFSQARRASGIEFDGSLVAKDAVESVCLLKKEGLDFSFTHRSLQEYFSAFCLTRLIDKNVFGILKLFAGRSYDQALNLAFEIKPDLVIGSYVLPQFEIHRLKIYDSSPGNSASKFFEETLENISFRYSFLSEDPPNNVAGQISVSSIAFSAGDFAAFHSALVRLSTNDTSDDNNFFGEANLIFANILPNSEFSNLLVNLIGADNGEIHVSCVDGRFKFGYVSRLAEYTLNEEWDKDDTQDKMQSAFLNVYFQEFVDAEIKSATDYCKKLIGEYLSRSDGLDDLMN